MKKILRQGLELLGYRVTRLRPANRFQAMDESLLLMQKAGYEPGVVIDAGANSGQFLHLAHPIFPNAEFHLIEPQPACREELEEKVRGGGGKVHFHDTAITEPGVHHVRMLGGGPAGGGTGAWVAQNGEHLEDEVEVRATTLDALFASRIRAEDRTLLKLDLESHEIPALRGATKILGVVEVILTEVSFYDVFQKGRPLFADTMAFLSEKGFELYDVANLSQRPRDFRLRMGDVVFARRGTPLLDDYAWE